MGERDRVKDRSPEHGFHIGGALTAALPVDTTDGAIVLEVKTVTRVTCVVAILRRPEDRQSAGTRRLSARVRALIVGFHIPGPGHPALNHLPCAPARKRHPDRSGVAAYRIRNCPAGGAWFGLGSGAGVSCASAADATRRTRMRYGKTNRNLRVSTGPPAIESALEYVTQRRRQESLSSPAFVQYRDALT